MSKYKARAPITGAQGDSAALPTRSVSHALLRLATALLLLAMPAISFDIPTRWNPWATLEIAAKPNWLTGFKLRRLASDAAQCKAVLATSSMRYTEVADKGRRDDGAGNGATGNAAADDGCGWHDAVRVTALPTSQPSAPFTLTCAAAVSLVMWEHHVLQPAADKHYEQPVTRIDHFGSYACRNVRGSRGEGGRLSQHANANALDVAGFRLRDGRSIRVAAAWRRENDGNIVGLGTKPATTIAARGEAARERDAAFLREVHQGACRFFSGALGPDYNAAHHDHFHLDRGPYRICR